MLTPLQNSRFLWPLTVILTLFCGCTEKTVTDKIAWPPDIPSPQVETVSPIAGNPAADRLMFLDIIALERQFSEVTHPDEEGERAMVLVHAIEDAVQHNVFKDKIKPKPPETGNMETEVTPDAGKPSAPPEFRPLSPVNYGDFYQWALAYREPDPDSMTAEPPPPLDLTYSIAVDETQIGPATIVTREVFGVLYTLISHQRSRALGLSEGDMMNMSPNNNPAYAYSELQDFTVISPWAKKFVGVAYQDGMYQKVFGLTPGKLVMSQGLAPQKAMTRAEAIVFLSQFFGKANRH